MLLAKLAERDEILEYKNIFCDRNRIVRDIQGENSKKFEFQYEDEGVNYKFCIFRRA
jgi:hypothetical protein